MRVSNRVADALSRREDEVEDGGAALALFTAVAHPLPEILELLREDAHSIPELVEIRTQIEAGTAPRHYTCWDGLIFCGQQLLVASSSAAKPALLYEHHSTPMAGHPGVDCTYRRLASSFYWPGMRRDVKQFVATCFDCQTTKYSTQKPAGLLQPLPIPFQV